MQFLKTVMSSVTQMKRIWMVARKPKQTEFITIMKTTGFGVIIIGLIGFAVTLVFTVFSVLQK